MRDEHAGHTLDLDHPYRLIPRASGHVFEPDHDPFPVKWMVDWIGQQLRQYATLTWRIIMAKQERYPYQPDFVLPPGDTILELLEERGMTQYQLAQRMGQSLKTINELIHGKMLLTAEIAWQLEKALGTPARLWLKLEHYYREHLDRRAADKTLQAQQGWLSHFPINSM